MPLFDFEGCHPGEQLVDAGVLALECPLCGGTLTKVRKAYPIRTIGRVSFGVDEAEGALLGETSRSGLQRFSSHSKMEHWMEDRKLGFMTEEENARAIEQEFYEDAQCKRIAQQGGVEALDTHLSTYDNGDVQSSVESAIKELDHALSS